MIAKDAFATGGSFTEAFTQLSNARRLAEDLHDDVLVAGTLNGLGEAHFYKAHFVTAASDDFNTAQNYFRQALELYETTYDERGICTSLLNSGRSYQNAGHHEQAAPLFQGAFELAERSQLVQFKAELIIHLGILALEKGDQETARARIVDSLVLRQEIGARCDLAYSHLALAEVCHFQGELATALNHYQQCHALAEEMRQQNVICAVLMGIGYIHLDEKRLEQAREQFNKAHDLANIIGLVGGIREATEALEEIAQ